MRYLTVLDNLEYRGSQRVAQNYSLGMRNLGHEVQVLTVNGLGTRTEILENDRIKCSCIKFNDQAFRKILNWSPDVVHIHRPGIYEPQMNQIIIELKEAINPLILETNFFSRVDYQIPSGYIDLHLHLTEWCLWKWLRWSQALKYKPLATVLPNSIITEPFYRSTADDILATKRKLRIPKNDFVFGRVGANCEAKWHPVLVEGFEQVAKQRDDISLLLVASPQSIQMQVKNLPSKIRQKVFTVSVVTDDNELRLLYSTMDTMLHASQIGESFGIVLAESLLCETPVITLSTPIKDNSQVEIIDHEKTGIVTNNSKVFIKTMKEIAGDFSKTKYLGKNGRSQMLAKYDNAYICSKINLLCNLLFLSKNKSQTTILHMLEQHGFQTSKNYQNISDKLGKFYGDLSLYENLMTQLVHQPTLYKFYSSRILPLKNTYLNFTVK